MAQIPLHTQDMNYAKILSIAWDPFEDHIIISLQEGTAVLVNYSTNAELCNVIQVFERQAQGINFISWYEDKSGDFISGSSKVGAIRVWNVAQP